MNRLDAASTGLYLNFSLHLGREPFIDGEESFRVRYIHNPRLYGTRYTLTDILESLQDYVENNIEEELFQVEGSGNVLDESKFLKINILRQGVPQAVGSFVQYPKGVWGVRKIFNPRTLSDKMDTCIV